ncbi:MAG: immunoglobulin domain-containing protein [Verrucomicrobia bacterium]|jgi:RHS repeat-associated protein|nr:immunoglobulin domain-containing protein [Verrucomicrobiota bacterium]OQC62751.1 MAG: tRNA3(Ser)-specific nuclease WapA precursor [Verrucomicrobia bacterium ADurb.Bin006]MDI9380418.1 immunoglobulin domain-containing protein [Verrucomicrobiota bacterium]HOA61932.1 immunoglobulin domain-containing protein [Verrucomicrobiota bacterium]HOF46959.1 immunoglobulin domain-containing protein [Verrucomicrobiota bacterium]
MITNSHAFGLRPLGALILGTLLCSTQVATAAPPRTVRLVAVNPVATQPFNLGVDLIAQGDENSVGFSLQFDVARLEYMDATAGSGGFSLLVNKSRAAQGQLGFALGRSAGTVFPSGTIRMVNVEFRARETTGTTPLAFADVPVVRETVGVQAQTLTTLYEGLSLEILPLVGPSITTQPEGATVHAGTNFTLRVVAAGSEPLRYQWQLNGQPLASATNATLELSSIRESQAGDYRVGVSNPAGSVTSAVARLVVLPPLTAPVIVRNPKPAFASAGERVTFTVEATGSEALSYQWQRQGIDLAGATEPVLVIDAVTTAHAGNYRVLVRNPVGSATSTAVALTVSATPRAIRIGRVDSPAGNLIELPIDLYALGDENAVGFSLTFDPAQLEYRGWRRGATAQGTALNVNTNGLAQGRLGLAISKPAGQRFSSGTSPLVYLQFLVGRTPSQTDILAADAPVRQEIADVGGRSRPAEFVDGWVNILDTPPSIVSAPADTVARLFSTVTLEVVANGSAPLYYEWRHNGQPVPGATSPTLTLASVMPDQAGDYQVVVSNAVAIAGSDTARLEVRRVVRLAGTNIPTGVTVDMPVELLTAGTENAVGFSLRYDPTLLTLQSAKLNPGFTNVTLNLRTNASFPGALGVALAQPPGGVFPTGTQAVMTLTFQATQLPGNCPLTFTDMPILREMANADAQSVPTDFVDGEIITTRVAPQITRHPVPREVTQGESAVFAVVASGSLPMTYQWLHNGVDLPGATNTTFSIVAVQPVDAGNYAVRLSNVASTVISSNALLTVNIPDMTGPVLANPTFDSQPLAPDALLTRAGTLRIDATDPSGVSRVEFYVDDLQVSADLDGADGFTAYLDFELFPDGPHTLSFRALDFRSNPAEFTLPVRFLLATLPPPVIGLPQSGTITSNQFVTIRGNAPAHSSVVLYRNDARAGNPVPVNHLGIFETTLPLLEGLNRLEAASLNRAGESQRSPEVTVTLDTSLPASPSGLRATARSGGRVLLEWVPSSESYRGYHVYRSHASFTDRSEAVRLTGSPLPGYTFEDTAPVDGQWFYRIAQVNLANVEGLLSIEAAVEVDRTPPTAALEYQPPAAYDPATGRVGRGIVGVLVNLSEEVASAPFLSFMPPQGQPIVIELRRVDPTQYRGNFVIDDKTPSGNAVAVFSARDKAGNRGTQITAGARLTIDTAAPEIVGLTVQPAEPIRNPADETVLVTLDLTLSEVLRTAAAPEITYSLSESAPTPQPVASLTPGADPVHWTVTFKLPAAAGANAETLTIQYQGEDDLGNRGSRIMPPHQFQVYQGDLPALVAPVSLSAKTKSAGLIVLEWQRVTDASDYAIYRKTPSATEFEPLTYTGDTNRWSDLPPEDGIYEYAVASVRRVNAQESVSELSDVAIAESDRRAPGAPSDLTLQLAKNGVFLRWTSPVNLNEEITYSLYRTVQTPPADLTGLTPAISGIPIAQVVDPAPRPDQPFYAVAAVDRAGNVSPPSNPGYLNIQLYPVQSLTVGQTNNDPPILTWTQVGSGVAGHDIFLGDANSNLHLNRRGLITDNRFIDIGFTGEERLYTIFTVDNNGQRSPGRTILLPALSAALDPDAIVKRGLMNRLTYTVRNDSTDPLNEARVLVTLGGRVHSSETFWLAGQSVVEIPVIVGGYDELPDGNAPLLTTIESRPEEGATVRWARSGSVAVGDGQLLIGVLASDLFRGAITKARFTLLNPSTEVLEVITATQQGKAPSSDIRMSLFNAESQLLSSTPFFAAMGTNLVLLPNGNIVLRLEPGQEVVSQEIDLPVPSSVPNHVWIQLEIDRVFYHSDREDRVEMRGVATAAPFVVTSTSYTGTITSVSPEHSRGGEPITISGRAWFQASRQPAPRQPLLVKIANAGFERTEQVVTDDQGLFTTQFTPLAGESGGIYSVWAVHPDLTDRTVQKQFVVDRVLASPTEFVVRAPHYYRQVVPLKVTTGAGTEVANLRLAFLPQDQPGRALPPGVAVDTGAPIASLGPNQTASMSFLVTGTPEATRKVDLVLRLVSGETVDNPWATIRAACEFSEAYPSLRWSPSLVDTGAPPGSNVVEEVTFENVGLVSATNVFFSLHKADGTAAPSWAALATPPNLAELAVGAKAIVGLTFRPPSALPEDDYWFKLKTRSGNHPTVEIGVHVAVLAEGRGNLAFKVVDMYTGTPGNDGVSGANIRLRNDAVGSFQTNLVTDINGEAVFEDLPSGLYDYHVTGENHNSSNGRAWVRAGSTSSQHVALAYSLVSVEWEVVPITIEDRYEIVLTAVFETDVPAPVVTIEPAAVNLPQLFAGDVFYGEYVIENHGLIRADNLQFQLPASDAYLKYEILAAVPDRLEAKQKVRIPYRITCLTSFPGPRTPPPTANAALARTRTTAQRPSAVNLDGLPPAIRQIVLMDKPSGICFTHTSGTSLMYEWICINGEWYRNAIGSQFWYNYSSGPCGTPGGGATWVGGGGATFSGPSASIPGLPECCPPEECEEEDPCDPKCCEAEGATCDSSPPPPGTPGSPGSEGSGGPDDSDQRVRLANAGGQAGARFKFINQLRVEPTGSTFLDSDRRRLTFERDSRGITTILLGKVPYTYLDSGRTLFAYRANRIQAIAGGYRWQNLDGKWEMYDTDGRLLKTGYRNLLQTRRFYDAAGRLSEVRDATGAVLATYTYNAAGKVATIADRAGRQAEYEYEAGRLVRARDVTKRETRYEYGPDSGCGQRQLVTRVTRPDGTVQNFRYRSAGCDGPIFLYSRLDGTGNGHFHEQHYDPNSRTYYLKITSTGGEVREKIFDSKGYLLEERVNGIVRRNILRSGRGDLITDAAGNEKRRDYDEFGKVIREVAPDGGVTTWEYDPRYHLPTRIEVPRGAVTLMAYDENGNLTNKIEAAGTAIARTNSWVYNALNQMLRHVDGRGNAMNYEYDARGNLVREYDPSNPAYQTLYAYDDRGNRVAITNALGHVTRFGYDLRDRVIAETNAVGHVTLYTYQDDNLIEVETGRDGTTPGRIVRYRYDDHGRRTQTLRVDDQGQEHVWETTSYDGDGHVIATANALGQTTRYEYDANGRRTKIARPFSATETSDTQYEYNDAGRLVREIDPLGVVTAYEYDFMGRQSKVTEAVGTEVQRSRERRYDLNGNLTSITYSDGTNAFTTLYEYDLLDRRIAIRGAREYPKDFEYDANDNLVAEINGRGYRTEYSYDQYNRRTNTVEGIGHGEPGEHADSFVYDLVGNVITAYDGNWNHRHYHHDALGHVVAESIPLAPTNDLPASNWWTDNSVVLNRTWHNPWSQPVATSNIVGAVTATVYDAFGRRFTHTDAAGLTLTNEYTALDQLSAINYPVVSTAPPGSPSTSIRYAYDPYNAQMLVSTTDRANLTTHYGYDRRFQRTSELSSWGALTTYGIDELGRQTAVTNALNEPTQSVFDQFDQLVATIYADHIPVTQERIEYRAYDEFGKMTNHWGAATYDVRYEYDLAGNQVKLVDGNGNPTRWEYDGRNRKVRKIYADNSDYEYGYDPNGNQTRKRDAMQRTTRYEFNAYNLLVRTDYPNDPDVTFGYDPAGRRVLMVDGTGTNCWTYDRADRILSNAQLNVEHDVRYTYDAEGNRLSMSVTPLAGGDDWRTDYAYDSAARLENITDHGPSETPFHYTWATNAVRLAALTYPSGMRTTHDYDVLGRKTLLSTRDSANVEIALFAYGHDKAGQRTHETTLTHAERFEYDAKRQLVSAQRYDLAGNADLSWSYRYAYDPIGNWTTVTAPDGVHSYTANSLNQYTAGTNAMWRTLDYDANGNLLADGKTTFAFNDQDRLVSASNLLQHSTFHYNGVGHRVRFNREDASGAGKLIYDGPLIVAQLSIDPAETYRVTRGLDISLSRDRLGGIGGLLLVKTAGTLHELVADARGDIRFEYWTSGSDAKQYAPFGSTDNPRPQHQPFGFATKDEIRVFDLISFGRRYYTSRLGRWLNRDPIAEDGGSALYAYLFNDPINRSDPFGLCEVSVEAYSPPVPHPYCGDTGAAGHTCWQQGWRFTTLNPSECSVESCPDGHAMPEVECSLKIVMWWTSRPGCSGRGSSRYHETVHVNIVKAMWNMRDAAIIPYLKCVSKPKAKCYRKLIAAIDDLYFAHTHLANTRWEIDDYTDPDPHCQKERARYQQAEVADEWYVRVQEQRMAAIKAECDRIKSCEPSE